ncbi:MULTISPECIES: Ig-like domain repeat protein [Nocardioides]|uniref:Ig-like domain (Group 3) n=1 Tax=Nocardioides lianchengensis TaxID=1045774 RepID=A0A1G6LKY3_9ACTN|nr:Ig-like domain repeat protein [Nocardioides lianchengensis]NYG12517.1 hypothetical protein [Nocardioides lianchengensis]SDC43968.1 Ig-like domain (group 3) [Nocardioides lianchengensis]
MDSHLKKNPLRRGLVAALAAAALLVPVVSAGPAAAVPDDGRGVVVVKVVDQAGKPVTAIVELYKSGEADPDGLTGTLTPPNTTTFDATEVGRYGVSTMSPWGGLSCHGVTPCNYLGMQGAPGATTVSVPGVLPVTDSETPAVYTVRLAAPGTITGTAAVGKRLTMTWSPTMKNLIDTYTLVGAGALAPGVQWLRDGVAIPNAIGNTYDPTGADAGRVVSARLSYPSSVVLVPGAGFDAAPRTIGGRRVARATSVTTVDVFRKKVVQGRSPGLRVDVTAGDLPATGKVKIKIGKRTYQKTLRNGSARVPVPGTLKPGRYKVVATYLGNASYSASKGTGRFSVVRKG